MRLGYSEEAVADLLQLREFIAKQNPIAANRIAKNLVAGVENLGVFPQIGVEVPEAPTVDTIRDMVFGDYVVRYAVQAESIVVLRVWHHLEDHRES